MNTVLISTWLIYLAVFFLQGIHLGWLKNSFLAVTIFAILQMNLIYQDALGMLLHFFAFFIFSYLHTKNLNQSILYSCLPLLNITLISNLTSQLYLSVWLNLLLFIVMLAIITFLEQLILKKLSPSIKPYAYLLPLLIFLWTYYQQLLALFDYLFTGQDTRLDIFNGILVAVMLLFLFTVILFDRNEKQVIYQEQLKAQTQIDREYLQLTNQQYNEMRKFRHDYQNILLSIEGYIQEEAWSELKAYFETELSTHSATNNQQFEQLLRLENANLRQIIYAKLAAAQLMNVSVNLEISETIHIQHPDQMSLSRMLGIVLDNAIEEVATLKNKAAVTIAFIKEVDATIILIANNCRENIEALSTLKNESFSTKGENRGYGLSNLASLQSRSNILVNTEITHQIFTQEIIIPETKGGVSP